MTNERLLEFFAYETIGAAIAHVDPIVEIPFDDGTNRVLRMSKTTYNELVAMEDDVARLERLKQLLSE